MAKKLMTVILCFALLASLLAIIPQVEAEGKGGTISDAEVVCEVPELREKNADTYLLSDGSYECVVYLDNKYFNDGTGKLVPINNSVVETRYMDGKKEYRYQNAANDSLMYFAENEPSVLLTYEGKKLGFSYGGENKTTAQTGGLKAREMIANYVLQGENYLAYADVAEQTDLVYAVYNGSVKEYIVLKESDAPTEFIFRFDTSDYTVKETELARFGFFDEKGELAFELGSLFAVDSAGRYTDQVSYELKELNEESAVISIKLSEEYAHTPERVYPILIDPSVMITGADVTFDTFVSSRYPNTNYFNDNHLRTGYDDDLYIRRAYMRFTLPNNISASSVTSAFIRIKQYIGTTPNMKAYRVTGSWTSGQLTWNNKPGYSTSGASPTAAMYSDDWYFTYITNMVKGWLNGTYSNYGFVLKDATESSSGPWSTFYSSEAASPNKPELHIRYNETITSYYEFLYWNSDANSICRWNIVPKITKTVLCDFGYGDFYDAYNYAIAQWTSAGIPLNTSATSGFNIQIIGGTYTQINEAYGTSFTVDSYADHSLTKSVAGSIIYGSATKTREVFSTTAVQRVFILANWENTYFNTSLRKWMVHELGHALGWLGHSPTSGTVMYGSSNAAITLSEAEIQHLLQYYNAY